MSIGRYGFKSPFPFIISIKTCCRSIYSVFFSSLCSNVDTFASICLFCCSLHHGFFFHIEPCVCYCCWRCYLIFFLFYIVLSDFCCYWGRMDYFFFSLHILFGFCSLKRLSLTGWESVSNVFEKLFCICVSKAVYFMDSHCISGSC